MPLGHIVEKSINDSVSVDLGIDHWCHWEQRFSGSRTEVGWVLSKTMLGLRKRLGIARGSGLGALVARWRHLGPTTNTPSVIESTLSITEPCLAKRVLHCNSARNNENIDYIIIYLNATSMFDSH